MRWCIGAKILSQPVVEMVAQDAWVISADFWYCEECLMCDHFGADAITKSFCLSTDISEGGIAAPTANEHDGEDWDSNEVHGHGSTTAEGVKADVIGTET